jgi:hypothetical protein
MFMELNGLMLKSEYFGNRAVFPPAHLITVERGVEVDLAYSCLSDAVKQTLGEQKFLGEMERTEEGITLVKFPIHQGDLNITKRGLEFGVAENFSIYKNADWPTGLRLPKEIVREYGLIREHDGTILIPHIWDDHNLSSSDKRKDFCFNFAIIYGNRLVERKYSG